MDEILNRLSGEQILLLVFVLAVAVVAVVAIVMGTWTSMHGTKLQAALKRDMLERGMSVEDICRLTESNLLLQQERIAADQAVRLAQIAAEEQRALARGQAGDGEPGVSEQAAALAETIANMIHGNVIDRDAVARLIAQALKRRGKSAAPPAEAVVAARGNDGAARV
jgi:hypothetical protein